VRATKANQEEQATAVSSAGQQPKWSRTASSVVAAGSRSSRVKVELRRGELGARVGRGAALHVCLRGVGCFSFFLLVFKRSKDSMILKGRREDHLVFKFLKS
jgi:hypothetical protein